MPTPERPTVSRLHAASPRGLADERAFALRLAAVLVAAALLLAIPLAQAATYKYVDENGKVHYTDKLPTEGTKGGSVLDKQARPIKKIESPPSAADIRAREAEEEQKRLTARANEEIARRDRALISSYTTEGELDLARSRSLATIDSQLESATGYVQQLGKRRDELAKRKAALDGKPMPAAMERELEGTDSELEKTLALIEQKRKERQGVVARYDNDRARWRELKAISDANAAAAAASASAKPVHPAAQLKK